MPVLAAAAAETLAARILEQEHVAYAEALRMLLTRRWRLDGRGVFFSWLPSFPGCLCGLSAVGCELLRWASAPPLDIAVPILYKAGSSRLS